MIYAAFSNREVFVQAIEKLRASGEKFELYLPYEIDELLDEKHVARSGIPAIGLTGAIIGLLGAFLMQVDASVWDAPLWVGGRPLFSWPAFVPVTFVLTVLCTALFVFVGWMGVLRLPWLHHEAFTHVDLTRHEFWIAADTSFEQLKALGADVIREVPQ